MFNIKSKKFVVLGLALAALISTAGISLAYWASSVAGSNTNQNGTVVIGEGDAVSTTVTVGSVSNTGKLVPAGRKNDVDEVESVTLPFSITWTSNAVAGASNTSGAAAGTKGSLATTKVSAVIGDGSNATANALVNVTLPANADIFADGAAVTVSPIITLSEPDIATYEFVANKTITVTFTFTVTVA